MECFQCDTKSCLNPEAIPDSLSESEAQGTLCDEPCLVYQLTSKPLLGTASVSSSLTHGVSGLRALRKCTRQEIDRDRFPFLWGREVMSLQRGWSCTLHSWNSWAPVVQGCYSWVVGGEGLASKEAPGPWAMAQAATPLERLIVSNFSKISLANRQDLISHPVFWIVMDGSGWECSSDLFRPLCQEKQKGFFFLGLALLLVLATHP